MTFRTIFRTNDYELYQNLDTDETWISLKMNGKYYAISLILNKDSCFGDSCYMVEELKQLIQESLALPKVER